MKLNKKQIARKKELEQLGIGILTTSEEKNSMGMNSDENYYDGNCECCGEAGATRTPIEAELCYKCFKANLTLPLYQYDDADGDVDDAYEEFLKGKSM